MNKVAFNTRYWIKLSLLNFCIVAIAGIILRYKINFPLPLISQKNLLHGHSHFAFTGWIASVLMALMVHYLQQHRVDAPYKMYNRILWTNCFVAFGMLVSFILQGYALYSITFSTMSILVSYVFFFYFWKDLKKVKDPSHAPTWFRAGLVIWIISSLGAFTLAYLMANQIKVQDYYFGAVYFFLHFQYNGWILFVCFGLLFYYISRMMGGANIRLSKQLFLVMVITVGPAYLLSVLWLKLPVPLRWLGNIAGVAQLVVLVYFIQLWTVARKTIRSGLTNTTRFLWTMAFASFLIKILLQLLSIFPALNEFAFGFRPIVIGYLHLSFLGIISFFIVGYLNQLLSGSGKAFSSTGIGIFVVGVILQEVILMMQGFEVFQLKTLPNANLLLFGAAIVMGTGLVWMTVSVATRRSHQGDTEEQLTFYNTIE